MFLYSKDTTIVKLILYSRLMKATMRIKMTQELMDKNKKIVNFRMDKETWRQARIRAAEQDKTLTEIVADAMNQYLHRPKNSK